METETLRQAAGIGDTSPEDRQRQYESLVAGELDRLYRTALTLTRKPEDAEDLVQETLLKAWRSFHSFKTNANPRGWLITILVNAYKDRYRAAKRGPATTPLESDDRYVYDEATDADAFTEGSPHEVVGAEGISDPVRRAIRGLPETFRSTLLLVDLEGFTYGEAAEILGIAVGTVMSRLHRARTQLSRQLAGYVAPDGSRKRQRLRKTLDPRRVAAKRGLISCGEACRHVHEYVDGILDDETTQTIDIHLSVCRRCCDRFEFERRQKALLVAHHLGTPVPRTLLQRLREVIAQF